MTQPDPGPRRPRNSRWSRHPASFRSGERPPDAEADLQRLTLYLPSDLLDRAEAQAHAAGAPSLQAYCEALLREAIAPPEPSRGSGLRPTGEDWVGDIDWDPASLAEWSSVARAGREPDGSDAEAVAVSAPPEPGSSSLDATRIENARADHGEQGQPSATTDEDIRVVDHAAHVVLRHAALGDEAPEGLIACLRRGDPIPPGPADELLRALIELERAYQEAAVIDRRLAFALHRLAFEGQVLLTDAWPGIERDPATVETLRLVQEAVDRVLSGEDIRYYHPEPSGDEPQGPEA